MRSINFNGRCDNCGKKLEKKQIDNCKIYIKQSRMFSVYCKECYLMFRKRISKLKIKKKYIRM